MTSTQLKLVRDDPRADGDAEAIEATLRLRIERMQTEIDALRGELDQHHRRDRALHGQMDRLDEEMRLAARLQRDFLPKTLPEVGRVRFRALFRPAGYVSGDLYDVQRLDEDHVGFYLADAVGHGMPAALLTMFLKRALTTKEITPGGYRLLDTQFVTGHLETFGVDEVPREEFQILLKAAMQSDATFGTQTYCGADVVQLITQTS